MKTYKAAIALLIILIIYNVSSVFIQQKEKYVSRDYWKRFPQLKQDYLDSQYVNKHPKAWIGDEFAQSYSGGELIKGTNPVLVTADTPPLGKYLIGLSAILFNNEHILTLIFGIFSLWLLYLVGTQIFSSKLMALLPPAFYSSEPIFQNQLIYTPLFDIIQLVFLLAAMYFFNRAVLSKKRYIILLIAANIFLGFFISTKFFITGTTIMAAWFAVFFFRKAWKNLITLTALFSVSVVVLLASYMRVFWFGYSFREFLGIQKWVFLYHKSQLILPLTIWPLIFFNKWYVWFGDEPVLSDTQWAYTWPFITLFSLLVIGFYFFKKIKQNISVEAIMYWIVFYLLFFSFGQIASRYLVILIPALYILTFFGVEAILNLKKINTKMPPKRARK